MDPLPLLNLIQSIVQQEVHIKLAQQIVVRLLRMELQYQLLEQEIGMLNI